MTTVNLEDIARTYDTARSAVRRRLVLCAGTGCIANGALKIRDALLEQGAAAGLDLVVELRAEDPTPHDGQVIGTGCQGFCQMGPLLSIEPEDYLYVRVGLDDVPEIISESLIAGRPVTRLFYQPSGGGAPCPSRDAIPFYARQRRTVLAGCGSLDPQSVAAYIHAGGYQGARRAFTALEPAEVCDLVEASGLRGRGGGGFPTGRKWRLTVPRPGVDSCVICNGDEGDPGAFMDRAIMEGNPHAVIEGMLIAARAVAARRGWVYVRAEYPLAVTRMRQAIAEARTIGVLGDDCFGSGLGFDLEIMEGAGAFVCGEETALIASIEGRRGMPMPKPPFPAQRGLFGAPTVINNVETLAAVPLVLRDGPQVLRDLGTENAAGTKTFALTGHVAHTGLIEVPFGTTLREIVDQIGGGVTDDEGRPSDQGFKAVQIGGPSGGCLTAAHADLPLDYDHLKAVGAMVGSGGLVVMNHTTCMVQVARFFMRFTQNESCGKCVLCREGTRQMLALLDDIIAGRGSEATLSLLEELGEAVSVGSLCGLGKTAANPVLSTLRHFRDEYLAHVVDQRCPAGVCAALCPPRIVAASCRGCTACIKACPVGAISGERRQAHVIDTEACIRCGACIPSCRFDAIVQGA